MKLLGLMVFLAGMVMVASGLVFIDLASMVLKVIIHYHLLGLFMFLLGRVQHGLNRPMLRPVTLVLTTVLADR